MTSLRVSRHNNYDDFREESDALMPIYTEVASRIIRNLTRQTLQGGMMHPDGFLKLSIGPRNGALDGQVRLHFWLPGRESTLQPHSHPWHLASLALLGSYSEYLPDLRQNDSGRLKKFRVTYPPSVDMRAGVHRLGDKTFESHPGPLHTTEEGRTHYLAAGPLHMSAPTGRGGITLAVMSPRFEDEAYFFSSDDRPYSEPVGTAAIETIMDMAALARDKY